LNVLIDGERHDRPIYMGLLWKSRKNLGVIGVEQVKQETNQ